MQLSGDGLLAELLDAFIYPSRLRRVLGYGLAGSLSIAEAHRRPRIFDVEVRGVRPVLEVAQAVLC